MDSNKQLDKETRDVYHEARTLRELVLSDGWKIARQKLVDKVLDLQNAFNIDDKTPEDVLIDLRARKLATVTLYDWLKEVEGSVDVADNVVETKETYIVNLKHQ